MAEKNERRIEDEQRKAERRREDEERSKESAKRDTERKKEEASCVAVACAFWLAQITAYLIFAYDLEHDLEHEVGVRFRHLRTRLREC